MEDVLALGIPPKLYSVIRHELGLMCKLYYKAEDLVQSLQLLKYRIYVPVAMMQ